MSDHYHREREVPPDRDGSCSFESACLCIESIMKDPRERQFVSKLDRYDLEDRYLRLLDEVQSLKKLNNSQEDKIKRLATKLMRFGAKPRGCLTAVDLIEERDRFDQLEAENVKLRNKICLLRNQLMNSKAFGRSPSRARKTPLAAASGPNTCRSENSRLKTSSCQCINARCSNEGHDLQNYSLKLQEMETEKRELTSRIAELELELANYASGNQREKVAENVEYIRVWRQMKRQNEKLVAAQTANEILNEQICQLKTLLEKSRKNNEHVSAELAVERKQVAQLDESISKVNDSQIDLKEKDERISDLMKEIEILQNHNSELLGLSSKFAKVEQDNVEFKRKLKEQLGEQQVLKDALQKEKANVSALQAANDQLLTKLKELQKDIDVMTIQLMVQSEKLNKSTSKNDETETLSEACVPIEVERSQTDLPQFVNSSDICKKCNDFKAKESSHYERGVQTSSTCELLSKTTQTEKSLDCAKMEDISLVDENKNKNKNNNEMKVSRKGNSLSREDMLKLLEQVQISTPLESQNATRLRHIETSSLSLGITRQVSHLEHFLFGDSAF